MTLCPFCKCELEELDKIFGSGYYMKYGSDDHQDWGSTPPDLNIYRPPVRTYNAFECPECHIFLTYRKLKND